MSDPLVELWNRADAREPRFSSDEVGAWPDGVAKRLADCGLIRRTENAESVVCDACAGGHVETVTLVKSPRSASMRANIHCPEHGRVRVKLDRLTQCEVDFTGMAKALSRAWELAGDGEEIVAGRVWFLGKATVAAKSREMFLARGLTWEDARATLGASARLNAAKSAIVFAAGEVPPEGIWNGDPPPVVALRTVVAFSKDGMTVDRSHLEALLSSGRKKAAVAPMISFPTPSGTVWSDVRLTITETELRVEAKGKCKDYTFQEAGFEERRKKDAPDRLWGLLKAFGMHGGVLPFKAVKEKDRTNLKQYVSDLRQRIAALLPGIEGESISYEQKDKSYHTAFKVSSEDALQFPTPPGASWTDVSIAANGRTGIRISVSSTERFATSGYADEDDDSTHQWEGAEREGSVKRTYDFRMLGLADDRDRPNRAGQSLLAVLSGKGTVSRKEKDKGMAELCGVLTKLMGIADPPFDFTPLSEKWVARFDVGADA